MSKLDQIRANALATRAAKNTRKNVEDMVRVPHVTIDSSAWQTAPSGVRKVGRPLAKDADKSLSKTKPWEAEGMSRTTWYRRKNVKKEEA